VRIGSEQTQEHADILMGFLEGVDLIYDATAEFGVQQFLADVARESSIPYVCVWTYPGAWGGLVARIDPGTTEGCWHCLRKMLEDGKIPYPPSDPTGNLQPAGCADPTFTGAGFDLTWIASSAVRMAVGSITEGQQGGYPRGNWDVLVLQTRDKSGAPIPPSSREFKLRRHPDCPRCSRA
jgi:hypothetical protein